MTLSDLSIRNPVLAWMMMLALLVFGGIGFSRMGVSQMPDVDYPYVNVMLAWEGAAPEVMETEVVDPIEESLMAIQGIKEVSSTARHGGATLTAEFELSKDVDVAVQEIQTKIAQAQRRLPRDMDPPILMKINPEDHPIMWVALSGSGERPIKEMMEYLRDHLKDRFQTIPGVGDIFLGGYMDPALRVWVDAERMHERQLTVEDIVFAIQSQHAELPAGRLETEKEERSVRVVGEATSLEEFSRLTIPQRVGGGVLWREFSLRDVARVEDGLEDIRRISRVMGKPAVGMGIRKQRGANAVEVARRVKDRIREVQRDLPEGLELGVNFDSARYVEQSIHELTLTLVLASLLTGLVCWLFLGSWSTTLNILLAIPTSICGAFMVMYFMGFTLNTITMLGLSLVIGIVVDDAIMVLENIVRHREKGESRVQSALAGAREITFAAVAASVAIAAIFLPVAFMKGIVGKFFFQFGVTITVAVAFSLLEAVTLAPMRCSQFLEVGRSTRVGAGADRLFHRLASVYRKVLERALDRRWTVLGGAALLFLGSLWVGRVLRKEMTPSQDMSAFLVRLQTPLGSSLAFTDSAFRGAERFLQGRPELRRYFGAIGGFGGGEVNTGILFVTLKDPKDRPLDPDKGRPLTQQEFMSVVRKGFRSLPGIFRTTIQDLSQGGMAGMRGFPVDLSVRGPDWGRLGTLSKEIMEHLETTGLVTDVDTDYQVGIPEVRVVPDRRRAAQRGVTVASVAQAINAMIGGIRVGKYTRGGRRYDIRVSLSDEDRKRPEDVSKIWVRNNRGELIRLSKVTQVVQKPTLLSINRKDRERSVAITANVTQGKSQADALAAAERIAREVLPGGYRLVVSGTARTFREAFTGLLFALVLGVVIAYMILGAQFNSFIHPFTVLLALPFSISGAFFALGLAGHSLNMMSMIGILLLVGIVKKNSILLVDFTNARRLSGLGVRQALEEACPVRLRPILMTSLSTVAAAMPAALLLGAGAESRAPMATVIIGGVMVSTLMTLFVVPCAYSLLANLESRKQKETLEEVRRELEK